MAVPVKFPTKPLAEVVTPETLTCWNSTFLFVPIPNVTTLLLDAHSTDDPVETKTDPAAPTWFL